MEVSLPPSTFSKEIFLATSVDSFAEKVSFSSSEGACNWDVASSPPPTGDSCSTSS
ncbi:hypothetical protein SESBI_21055 [Sesbania bispinosa]|nr:hypothetical protein SESBI_21055 [Sesbania bispinosa]